MGFASVSLILSIIGYTIAFATGFAFRKTERHSNIVVNLIILTSALLSTISAITYFLLSVNQSEQSIAFSSMKNSLNFFDNFSIMNFSIAMDSLSAFFVLMLSLITVTVSIFSMGYMPKYFSKVSTYGFNTVFPLFILSLLLVFTAKGSFTFFFSWELMTLTSWFLVIFDKTNPSSFKAGLVYFIMSHIASALLLSGLLLRESYSVNMLLSVLQNPPQEITANIIFVLLFLAFAVKAGLIPLHIWLPKAHPAAPANVSALMSGVMLKTAVYGMLRFFIFPYGMTSNSVSINNFPPFVSDWWGILLIAVGMTTAVLSAIFAVSEKDIKKMLAFSSMENLGIIFSGIGIAFIAISQRNFQSLSISLVAVLIHSFNHAIFKSALFLGAGAIEQSTHTRNMDLLGGLAKKMPILSVFVLMALLSASSIIPFNGFYGEWLTFQSLISVISPENQGLNLLAILAIAALALSAAIAAAAAMKLFGISFLGLSRSEAALSAQKPKATVSLSIGILSILCLITGLVPWMVKSLSVGVLTQLSKQNGLNYKMSDKFLEDTFSIAQISKNINGGLLSGLTINSNISGNINPLGVFLLLFIIILISILLFRKKQSYFKATSAVKVSTNEQTSEEIIQKIRLKKGIRTYGTWDCGFNQLTSRMQYTATGFSKPFRIAFRLFYRPTRELKHEEGSTPYSPKSITYKIASEPFVEKYMYAATAGFVKRVSKKVKFTFQAGSVHIYLLYIFIVLIALMLYARIFSA